MFVASIWRSRFKEWTLLPVVGRSGGILVIWDVRSVKVKECLMGDFSISILTEDLVKGDWWFSGIYGPCKRTNGRCFWDEIAGLWVLCYGKWCVGGDFNVVRWVNEKFNSPSATRSRKEFDDLIRELNLVDLPLSNAQFTWTNFRNDPICCRLDRFLFTRGWGDFYFFEIGSESKNGFRSLSGGAGL